MTILITGATGLVRERLVIRLIEARDECYVLIGPGDAVADSVSVVEGDLLNAAPLAEFEDQ